MEKNMLNDAIILLDEGKKSLETLLREKAYSDVLEKLKEEGIAIKEVNDEDIEALVAAKVDDMMNGIKGFAVGGAFTLLLSSILGF